VRYLRLRKVKTIYLGESLTTILSKPKDEDLIISYPGSESTLSGWVLRDLTIDKAPIFVENPKCVESLGGHPVELDYHVEVLGTEEDLSRKFNGVENLRMFWLHRFKSKAYIPHEGWSTVFKVMKSKIKTSRLYTSLSEVSVSDKTVKLEGGVFISYEKLINTIPQKLFLSIVRSDDLPKTPLNDYVHIPLHITAVVTKNTSSVREGLVKVYSLGKKRYIPSHVVLYKTFNVEYTLNYVITPLTSESIKSELLSQAISTLKKLGVEVKPIYAIRTYFEPYGVLAGKPENVVKSLEKYDIEFRGRYGMWSELSICDILRGFGLTATELT